MLFQQAKALSGEVNICIAFLYPASKKNEAAFGVIQDLPCFYGAFCSLFDLREYVRLKEFCITQGVTTIYSSLNDANVAARLLGKKVNVPVYVREANVPNKKNWKFKLLDILLSPWTAGFIAVSEEVALQLRRYLPWMKHTIHVLYNGIRESDICIPKRKKKKVQKVLMVGSLTKQKNYRLAIDSFSRVKDETATLTIVGEGSLRADLEKCVQEKGIQDRVTFIGNIPYAQVLEAYRTHDLFLLSSDWEGCPNVVLEALANGLPLIATDVSGIREILGRDTRLGKIVPKQDAQKMASALQDMLAMLRRGDTQTIAEQAVQRIQTEYSFSIHIGRLKKILNI